MTSDVQDFQWITPERLEANPFNPNKMAEKDYEAMKKDMNRDPKTFFINNMIRVTPKDAYYGDPDQPFNEFIIVDGFHKWRSATELGLEKVPIIIRNLNKAQARRECFRINRQRGQIDPLKEGLMYMLDVEEGFTQEEIARDYGVAQSQVSRSLALTRLPESVLSFYRTPESAFSKYQILEWEKSVEESVNEGLLGAINSHLQATGSAPSEEEVAEMEEAIREEIKNWPRYERPDPEPTRKLTRSHLEIIGSLPTEELQIYLALRIMEGDRSVRVMGDIAGRLKKEYEQEQLLEEARGLAQMKKCPECGDPIVRAKEVKGELLVSCNEYDYRAHWWPVTMRPEDYVDARDPKEKAEKKEGEARVKLWFKTPLETEAVDEALGIFALKLSRGFESVNHIYIQGELNGISSTLHFEGDRANRVFRVEYAPEIEKPDFGDVLGSMFAYNNEHFEPVLRGSHAWPQDMLKFSYKSGGWKTGPHKTRVEVGYEHTAHASKLLEDLEVFLVKLAEGKVGPLPSRTVGGPLELAREFVEFYERKKAEKMDL